jgi:putative ABC transport system permease protein
MFSFFILYAVLSFVFFNIDKYNSPLGFETENIWMSQFNMPQDLDSASIVETKTALLQQISSLPEIEEVCFSNPVGPLSNSTWTSSRDDNGYEITADMAAVDDNFAKTMGIKLVSGKWFSDEDKLSKYEPIVINKKMKDLYWPDTTVIGKVIIWQGEQEIIGVMENYKYRGEFDEESNMILQRFPKHSDQSPNLIMRLSESASPEIEVVINNIIRQTAKGWGFSIFSLETERQRRSRSNWIPIIALLSICGFLIFNVSLGLFGILVYNIKKRRSEIGLRRAIGASPGSISYQFIMEIILITTFSIILSAFFAIQLPLMGIFDVETSVYLRAMLFSALILYSLVLICTIYPSQQASLVHPATALHEE